MKTMLCTEMEPRFSEYLDGSLPGSIMVEVQRHLERCPQCAAGFKHWQATLTALGRLGPLKAPATLSLQLRVALSHERERTVRARLNRLKLWWQDNLAPLAVQASAACASLLLTLGTLALLVGAFAAPQNANARDQPIGMATPPRLLYATLPDGRSPLAQLNGLIVVRVYVNSSGRVYDYHVLSGDHEPGNRSALANEMMWSVFEPAQVFGQPVRGSLILSLAGVSVPG